jgi:hypothetical protein
MVVGDILHDKPISPDDAVVFIQGITIPETRVHELNLTFMSDCLHKFIRWPRIQIKQSELPTTPNLHLSHVHCTPSPLMSQMSNTSTYDRSSFEHTMEGLPESHARRPYVHRTRAPKKSKGPRILGVSRADKVTLTAVREAKIKRPCQKQCLQNIDEHDILSLRYQALGMTKYKDRTCWILTTLRGFRVSCPTAPMQMKFEARIVGQKVCIACFANAVGYSLRRLNSILSEIREIDVIDVFHGNCGKRREATHISMARAHFESYIKFLENLNLIAMFVENPMDKMLK